MRDNTGLSSSKIVAITVNTPPVAKAAASPASGYAPLTVGFSSAGSYDSDGSIQSYSWLFSDGTTSSSSNPSRIYNSPGTYVAVLTVTDNQGGQGTGSVTISAKQDPTKLPDLIVSSAAASASSAAPGATVTVSDTTKNQGTSLAAAASTTSIYLSLDSVWDPGDTLIGGRSIGGLSIGTYSSGSTPVTIPADATPGTRYLIVRADGGQAVDESIETNNTKTISITIALPDLQVSALYAPSLAAPGLTITVTDTTKNYGTVAAAASKTFVYFSLDSILDSGDTLIGNFPVGVLGSGSGSSGSTPVTIPADATPGTRYLILVADGGQTVRESIETNNTKTTSIVIALPDLQVSALSAPSSALPGSSITVTDTTKNYGTGPAAASKTFVYLSLDSILDPGDTLIGSRPVGVLSSGSYGVASTLVTIPADATPGIRYLIVLADGGQTVPESIETNNTRTTSIAVGPDLRVPALSAPSSALPGSAITVTDTTQNFATVPAAASTTFVYFSRDSILDSGDTLIGNRPVGVLGGGSSSAGSTVVTIPADTTPGTYYLIVLADGGQAVAESIETNNTRTTSIAVGPDLQVSALSAPTSALPGSAITVTDTTNNLGTAPAAASTTLVYFSLDSILDPGDTLIGNRPVGVLGSGSSSSGSTQVTIPAGAPPGTRYLIVLADGGQTVAESIETNNTRTTSITIPFPDLLVSALSATTSALPGATITVTDTTKNYGTGLAPASTTFVYFSVDSILGSGDTLIGNRPVGVLGGGTSSAGSTVVTIPADATPGTRYLIVRADGGQAVAESIETNNTMTASITILGPDLQVSALSAPASANPGSDITVTDTTNNLGTGPAAASTTRYYLSADNTYDTTDILIGSRSIGTLLNGASSSGSATVTIPAGTALGKYYIIARADGEEVVAETNETNNTGYYRIYVQ